MKPSTALTTHMALGTTTIAHAIKITREDAAVFGYTSHVADAVISAVTYSASPGLNITDIVIAANADVGNLEMTVLHDGTLFSMKDIRNGVWRNAAFTIFRYNFSNLADGIDTLLAGTFGEPQIRQNNVVVELRDLRQYLQQSVGSASSKTCRYRLGLNNGITSRCPVRVNPPTWAALTAYTVRRTGDAGTGSVVKPSTLNNRHYKCTTAGTTGATQPTWNTTIGGTTTDGTVTWTTIQALTVTGALSHVTSNQIFRDSSRTEAVNRFDEGEFTFLTGANAGSFRKIKSYAADGTWTLVGPFWGNVLPGDTYTAIVGCRKRREEDCRDTFDAVLDFGGEADRQGLDEIMQKPTADV